MNLPRPTSRMRTALAIVACLALPWCVLASACDDAQSGRGGLFGDNPRPPGPDAEPEADAAADAPSQRDAREDAPRDATNMDAQAD